MLIPGAVAGGFGRGVVDKENVVSAPETTSQHPYSWLVVFILNQSIMKHQGHHSHHPDNSHKLTFSELEDEVYNTNRFSHLQIFLSRKREGGIGKVFLMVSRKGFLIVRLVDLQYENETILIDLMNMEVEEEVTRFYLDIYDPRFKFVLLNLQDIKNLVKAQISIEATIDALLELDED